MSIEIDSLISSFSLNILVLTMNQVFKLTVGIHPFIQLFNLIYEVSIIFFVFQLGALRYMRETGESLETYFIEEGGFLVLFTIGCLIFSSLGYFFSDWSNYKLNEVF